MNSSDFSFKIVLIGDSGVGKSCFLLRFADDKFNDNFYTTVGVDFRFKSIEVNEKNIKYEIVSKAYLILCISMYFSGTPPDKNASKPLLQHTIVVQTV